ncbi:MAG: hypothetical protein VSS75_023770 [Candidatus Parabeggiatoa sp.]|nr:hypothetical protein [Candidatus Parabeggiatoa sp.]
MIWQAKPRRAIIQSQAEQGEHTPSRWLIFADRQGVGKTNAPLLEKQGHSCFLVYAGNTDLTDQHIGSINPSHLTDFEGLFEKMRDTEAAPIRGIIHLWSLDSVLPDQLNTATLEQAQTVGAYSALYLVQTLIKQPVLTPAQIGLVTQNVVPLTGRDQTALNLAQSPLWGLGKVIALEQPEIWGGLIDLELIPSG